MKNRHRNLQPAKTRRRLAAKFLEASGLAGLPIQRRIFLALVAWLGLVFLLGGGSRYDVQSLVLLRPLAALFCGFALLTVRREHLQQYRFMVIMAGVIILLAGLHIVPLPPSIWQALPGREIVREVEASVGLRDVWRPLTLAPDAGANAFFALLVPLAAFLLTIQLDSNHLQKLVTPILIIGALSGLLGIAQVVGSPDGPLYLYRITNNGSAVGLFSNRNHQALFLATLIPLLAFYGSQSVRTENERKMRLAAMFAAMAILVPLLLVTGSRQGLVLGLAGFVAAWFVFRQPTVVGVRQRTEKRNYSHLIAGASGLFGMALITVVASRAVAIQRLLENNPEEDSRLEAWSIVLKLIGEYAPLGSGSGSFVPVFRRVEPLEFLTPQYLNHAHNDFLEVVLNYGVPGAIVLLMAIAGFALSATRVARSSGRPTAEFSLARVGAVIVLLSAAASAVDYPLRTPSLACLFMIACCWLHNGLRTTLLSAGTRHRG